MSQSADYGHRYEVVNECHERTGRYPWTVIERVGARGFHMTTWHAFPDEASARRFAGTQNDSSGD